MFLTLRNKSHVGIGLMTKNDDFVLFDSLLIFFTLTYMPNIEVLTRVVVQGPGPGPRYGHVMALVGQRYLMCIGGNDGEYNFFWMSFLRILNS